MWIDAEPCAGMVSVLCVLFAFDRRDRLRYLGPGEDMVREEFRVVDAEGGSCNLEGRWMFVHVATSG